MTSKGSSYSRFSNLEATGRKSMSSFHQVHMEMR